MNTPEEIAQWVIDNRYPKSEKEKVSDHEMYHELVVAIEGLNREKKIYVDLVTCITCVYMNEYIGNDPCITCKKFSNHKYK